MSFVIIQFYDIRGLIQLKRDWCKNTYLEVSYKNLIKTIIVEQFIAQLFCFNDFFLRRL